MNQYPLMVQDDRRIPLKPISDGNHTQVHLLGAQWAMTESEISSGLHKLCKEFISFSCCQLAGQNTHCVLRQHISF